MLFLFMRVCMAVNDMFAQTAFMQRLRSRLLQQHCCRYLRIMRVEEGDLLYKQGEEATVGNWRQLEITSQLALIQEAVLCNRLRK